MRLHFDMTSGVAGDMLVASLLDLISEDKRADAIHWLTSTLLYLTPEEPSPIVLNTKKVYPGGIQSLKINFITPEDDWNKEEKGKNEKTKPVIYNSPQSHKHSHFAEHTHPHDTHHQHNHTHTHHRNFTTIKTLINFTDFSPWVKDKSLSAFEVLAKAEGEVHGIPFEKVHFHEVGSLDAIYEVCGFFLLAERLGIKAFSAGQIVIGTGTVRCAHGLMPVPVPAVLNMLKTHNVPYKKMNWETGELTTPTGLAILLGAGTIFNDLDNKNSVKFKHIVEKKQEEKIIGIGYGAGHKSIPGLVNCLRATQQENIIVGEEPKTNLHTEADTVIELKTNIDDMTGEELAYLVDALFSAGALDVVQYPVIMKKGRHGVVLEVLTIPDHFEKISERLFSESTTLGIRYCYKNRSILPRRESIVEYKGFKFKIKHAGKRYKIEDESLRAGLKHINQQVEGEILKQTSRKQLLSELERIISDSPTILITE